MIDVANVLVREIPEALCGEVLDELCKNILLGPKVIVGVLTKYERERLCADIECDLYQLGLAVLLDHVLADLRRELRPESAIRVLIAGIPGAR